MDRPQLTPGTSHHTTRYEIETRGLPHQLWWLRNTRKDLSRAKKLIEKLRKERPAHEYRLVVVSETRRTI